MGLPEDAAQLEAQIRLEIQDILSKPGGRYLFWRIFEETQILAPVMSATGEDAMRNEGSRNVGLALLDLLLQHYPEMLTLVREEGRERDAILGSRQTMRADEDE